MVDISEILSSCPWRLSFSDIYINNRRMKLDLDRKRVEYEYVLHFAMSKASSYPAYARVIPLILGELELMNQLRYKTAHETEPFVYLFLRNDSINDIDVLGLLGGCVPVGFGCSFCVGSPCDSAPIPDPPPVPDPCKIMPPAPPPPGTGVVCIIC